MLKSRAMIARHRPMGPEPPSSKKQLGISSLSMGQKRNVAYRRVLKLTTKDMVEWSCEKVFDVNTYITLFNSTRRPARRFELLSTTFPTFSVLQNEHLDTALPFDCPLRSSFYMFALNLGISDFKRLMPLGFCDLTFCCTLISGFGNLGLCVSGFLGLEVCVYGTAQGR